MTVRLIAHYEILEKLGEGGMGVVYKARDTHLDRFVAIKLLSGSTVHDELRLSRFVREAKAASALNHPNIITVHDIESDNGVMFIAMEHVRGRTLEALIRRRGLTVKETVRYAIEVADALGAAHAAGIVHRDVKPGNIMITEQGHVKVLDFGLAKLREHPASEGDSDSTRTIEPRTEAGAIVGTVAYMSPEQAQGGAFDTRSDIFAFGAVMYEMLTGRRAFQGTTAISLLAAIIKDEPKRVGSVIGGIPSELERVVARCLRKDPARRFQNVSDLKVALEEVLEEADGTKAASDFGVRPNWRWLLSALLITAFAASAALYWQLKQTAPASPLLVLRRLTSDAGLTTDPALSPDATLIAYASDRSGEGNLDIWVQPVNGGEAVRLTRHGTDNHQPAFSPDGAQVAYRSERDGGGIYIMPALGGEPRLLARNGVRPRFSPDGSQILYSVGGIPVADLYVVPATGGLPRSLESQVSATDAVWAPDGKHVLFFGLSAPLGVGRSVWYITTLDGAPRRATAAREVIDRFGLLPPPGANDIAPGLWLERENQVVFSARLGDTADLWSLGLSPITGEVTGVPRRLTVGTGLYGRPSFAAVPSARNSRRLGMIALASLTYNVDVWSLPLNAEQGAVRGEMTRLTRDPAPDTNVSAARDGNRVVFASTRSGGQQIWMKDLRSGTETQLTSGPAPRAFPRISADGNHVAYATRETEKWSVYAMSLDSRGRGSTEQRLCEGCGMPTGWSLDANRLLYVMMLQLPRIGLIDRAAGFNGGVLSHPKYNLWQAEFSPDDRWVAFMSVDGPIARLHVVPADALRNSPPPETWIEISDGQTWDDKPRWSSDGNLLYFLSERDGFRCLWAQRLEPRTKRPSGAPIEVKHFHSSRLSLMNVEYPSLETSITRNKLFLSAGEITGNIWVAEILQTK